MAKATKNKRKVEKGVDATAIEGEVVLPETLPVLPAKDLVAFPGVMMSFYITRQFGIRAIESSLASDKLILVLTQKDEKVEEPTLTDLYSIGVVASIVRVLRLSPDRYKILIQGIARAEAVKLSKRSGFFLAKVEPITPQSSSVKVQTGVNKDLGVLVDRIQKNLRQLVEIQDLPDDLLMVVEEVDEPGALADLVVAHLKPELNVAQAVLEEQNTIRRLELVDALVKEDLSRMHLHMQMRDKTSDELSKGQREFYLREQIRLIRQELGEEEEEGDDLAPLRKALSKLKLPVVVREEADKQLRRLEKMNPELGDAALLRTYLEWITDLPWTKLTKDKINLFEAKKILDRDHHGLEKVKDRILEHLSVRKLNKKARGPILCLVGPPGVGKTSLGRSIAEALGRTFVRASLGGMRDEAEIRGHRRTYVGALPGRILQGLKQAGSRNPVFVLDELDKVGADFRGDPAAALLEVLDPEQNREFSDHYLNVPFDLSDVMFVATANTVDTIPTALLDRLEVIQIPGYTTPEKLEIAKSFLVPKQLKENGLITDQVEFDDNALNLVITNYTQEAGVRNLEREVASLCRKIARQYAEGRKEKFIVSMQEVGALLGPMKFEPEQSRQEHVIGVATGLAWTLYGGDTLLIEASIAPGKGALSLTGQLGDIMQESGRAAVFFARANADKLGLDPEFHQKFDIHIHVPAGATPKDGPSAGITICVALVSALSNRRVSKDIAMTGEMTLRGNVLPIGGIKEKALAALRYGIKRIVIPHDNLKDLIDIPSEQRQQIEFIAVKHVSEVLRYCLVDTKPIDSGKSKGSAVSDDKRRQKKVQTPISGTV